MKKPMSTRLIISTDITGATTREEKYPMTGAQLKRLRHDLGDAIGRRLSVADMAKLCGLAPANGADTWRKWEEGEGPSGPVAALMSLYAYATDDHLFIDGVYEVSFRKIMREII